MSELIGAERHALAYSSNKTQENRDRLVFAAEPVIRSIISKIRTPGDDLSKPDELYQVGVIAVLQALDQFDPSTGVRFVTFAYPRIRGEIVDFLRRLDPLPRRRRVKVAHARSTFDRVAQQTGNAPSESEVADAMGVQVSAYRVIQSDSARRQVTYLFDNGGEEEGLRLVDVVADETAISQFESMEWEDIRSYLDQLATLLSERDRTIIELNYGEELTLAEIGLLLGISEARVSQLRKTILNKLAAVIEPALKTAA